MTDKEMLIHLCERLGLERSDDGNVRQPHKEYIVMENLVSVGSGNRHVYKFGVFWFDNEGNILRHEL